MKARDVMVSPVITVRPYSSVQDLAKIFMERHISAVPVVDERSHVVGIVSEGDLIHRYETGTERHRSWWLQPFVGVGTLAAEYVKAHARKVADVMTRNVICADPDTPLYEIATMLEKNSIKRVPIVKLGQLVGIVTRANLVQALAGAGKALEIQPSDAAIRDRLLKHLRAQPWAHTSLLNVTVTDGVVDLWGMTTSKVEREAVRVAAESINGVRAVNDNLADNFVPAEILDKSELAPSSSVSS
jgi:CBS domain-containing protein